MQQDLVSSIILHNFQVETAGDDVIRNDDRI